MKTWMKLGVALAIAALALGCGGDEEEADSAVTLSGACLDLVECHEEMSAAVVAQTDTPKSETQIRFECETLVMDDFDNDEAACSVGLEDMLLMCPGLPF